MTPMKMTPIKKADMPKISPTFSSACGKSSTNETYIITPAEKPNEKER